jgi:hypothetical protein
MTFEQFRATGRDVADIGPTLGLPEMHGVCGRVYVGDLHIVFLLSRRWSVIVGNRETVSAELVDCERALYEFAVDEGVA